MDPNDLLKMLDLGGTEAVPPGESLSIDTNQPAKVESIDPTALEVDEWGLRRGRDLIAESERLKTAGTDEFAAADFFCAGFDPDPRLKDACRDTRRHEFLTQLLATPEYRALHAATHLDDTAASIAAVHFAEEFAKLQQDDAAKPADAQGREMAAMRAVGRALSAAKEDVGELHETAAALGLGPGSPGANDARAIAELFKRVRGDAALRRICELAGRFRRVAQSKQRQKVIHGLDDMVGVETGGDLARLLPHELAKLAVPELELDTLRRLVERQTLCREYRATEPVGKGPIIVVVDESGSMNGEKVHTAKAMALALAWIARRQRRWCALVAYSGDSGERLLALPPARWDETALADWLSAFIGHGSDLDVPIRELPRMYADLKAPVGATDVILVTDAQVRIPEAIRVPFLAWKAAAKVRVHAFVLNDEPGDLADVSDEVHRVASLDPAGDAVGRVLSL
ncbi:MAG TPA: hypothetical protein VHR72_01035 [Gemmataceae bacterium]|jgi:uncharacterized protein with von Willebrand factor type A (vWA) domain|nr:hypothetical protein [Gemmataceae bacterium]